MSPIDPALREVPATMLAEYGIRQGRTAAWRCNDPGVELVPLVELRVPATRGLYRERLRRLLSGIAAGHSLPAIPVFREPDAVVVLDGMHRVAVARVAGFTYVPCMALDEDEARDAYRYPAGQRNHRRPK